MAAAAELPVQRPEPPTAAAQRRHRNVSGDSPAWGEGAGRERGMGVDTGKPPGGGAKGEGTCWRRSGEKRRKSRGKSPGKPAHSTEHARHCSHMLSRLSRGNEAALPAGGSPRKSTGTGDLPELQRSRCQGRTSGIYAYRAHQSRCPIHRTTPILVLNDKCEGGDFSPLWIRLLEAGGKKKMLLK